METALTLVAVIFGAISDFFDSINAFIAHHPLVVGFGICIFVTFQMARTLARAIDIYFSRLNDRLDKTAARLHSKLDGITATVNRLEERQRQQFYR